MTRKWRQTDGGVVFSFSHVNEAQRTTLSAFFPQFFFLPLAADLKQDPQVLPLAKTRNAIPVYTSQARLNEVASRVSAWLNWAAVHQGNERNLKRLIQDDPYLTEHLGQAAVQSELRARMAGSLQRSEANSNQADPLLFSIIAKLTDAENEAIDQGMAGLEKKRAALFSQLRGDPNPTDPDKNVFLRDPGAVLTRERIRAWAACAKEENLFSKQGPRILVTTSSAVFEEVSAIASRVMNALDIDALKVHEDGCGSQAEWHKQVQLLCDTLAVGPVDDTRARMMLDLMDDPCVMTGRIQVRMVEGPDLKKKLSLPGHGLQVCRVTLNP